MKSDEILIKTFDQVKNDNFDQVKFDQVIVCQTQYLVPNRAQNKITSVAIVILFLKSVNETN
jgi:hypothetical protein